MPSRSFTKSVESGNKTAKVIFSCFTTIGWGIGYLIMIGSLSTSNLSAFFIGFVIVQIMNYIKEVSELKDMNGALEILEARLDEIEHIKSS